MTFVYVSNAEDSEIGQYTLRPDGSLQPGPRFKVGGQVMPMSVSPDKRFLVAAVRSAPFAAYTYGIDRGTGALKPVGSGPLAESFPYITHDRTGRFLLSASYSADLVSVNPVKPDGTLGEPSQVIPTARHAHAIIIEKTNRYVFVPHLGTDQVFQFVFDEKTGRLSANKPPAVQLAAGTGPRHLVMSPDNSFVYLLNELTATVTTLSLDAKTGTLSEKSNASALPPETRLGPGMPRPQPGRDVSKDIWASDIHVTPDGRFVYAAERTSSTISALAVDRTSGNLTYLSSTPTEKQPRGFRIHRRFMVVSGEKSDTISSYRIESTGLLTHIGKYPTGKGSNWVEILNFD